MRINGCKLVMTCDICPEQYDVFNMYDKKIGYLRLRHGHFTAHYPDIEGKLVYSAVVHGDGCFDVEEAHAQLSRAIDAILNAHTGQQS